jgi:hypothetical protein
LDPHIHLTSLQLQPILSQPNWAYTHTRCHILLEIDFNTTSSLKACLIPQGFLVKYFMRFSPPLLGPTTCLAHPLLTDFLAKIIWTSKEVSILWSFSLVISFCLSQENYVRRKKSVKRTGG